MALRQRRLSFSVEGTRHVVLDISHARRRSAVDAVRKVKHADPTTHVTTSRQPLRFALQFRQPAKVYLQQQQSAVARQRCMPVQRATTCAPRDTWAAVAERAAIAI